MLRKILPILFIILFVNTLALPTVLYVVDNNIDVSLITDFSEEEEEKSNETNSEFELYNLEYIYAQNHYDFEDLAEDIVYKFKAYTNPHFNLIIPPPDLVFTS